MLSLPMLSLMQPTVEGRRPGKNPLAYSVLAE